MQPIVTVKITIDKAAVLASFCVFSIKRLEPPSCLVYNIFSNSLESPAKKDCDIVKLADKTLKLWAFLSMPRYLPAKTI
jgi:hypothetical protein